MYPTIRYTHKEDNVGAWGSARQLRTIGEAALKTKHVQAKNKSSRYVSSLSLRVEIVLYSSFEVKVCRRKN